MRLIAVGAFHNLALEEDGRLLAWGNNEYGQLGTGDTQPSSLPVLIHGLHDLTLVRCFFSPFSATALLCLMYKRHKLQQLLSRLILLREDGIQPL